MPGLDQCKTCAPSRMGEKTSHDQNGVRLRAHAACRRSEDIQENYDRQDGTQHNTTLAAEGVLQQAADGHTTHTDGSVHNNATPWATATMGMVSNFDGHACGMALDGNIQSIDRAELKSTILMAENGAKRFHTDSMYIIVIWRRVIKFVRERKKLIDAQLQHARNRWQKWVASPNAPNHDLVDRLQTHVQDHGEVIIQKVKGTDSVEEAETGQWPLDRLGNSNADAAANRIQQTSTPSLPQVDGMVEDWKAKIQQHRELLAMMLEVSKAYMNKQKGIEHELANPLERPWQAKWPRATRGISASPVGLPWTIAVMVHSEAFTRGGPNKNTRQCERTVTFIGGASFRQ